MVRAAFRDESHTVPISYLKKLLTDLMDKFIATISCALITNPDMDCIKLEIATFKFGE